MARRIYLGKKSQWVAHSNKAAGREWRGNSEVLTVVIGATADPRVTTGIAW